MAASEQLGSGRGFKQHYSSGTGTCMPFGQLTWHCFFHVNMFAHAVRFSPQYQSCNTKYIENPFSLLFSELTVENDCIQKSMKGILFTQIIKKRNANIDMS